MLADTGPTPLLPSSLQISCLAATPCRPSEPLLLAQLARVVALELRLLARVVILELARPVHAHLVQVVLGLELAAVAQRRRDAVMPLIVRFWWRLSTCLCVSIC